MKKVNVKSGRPVKDLEIDKISNGQSLDQKIINKNFNDKVQNVVPGLEYEEASPLFKEATDPTFLTNEDEIQQMENDLLNLVDEFGSGKHNAFDQALFEKMDRIRDQQEGLAKLHFELNLNQETAGATDIDASRTLAEESMTVLMGNLNDLSNSLHQLYETRPTDDPNGFFGPHKPSDLPANPKLSGETTTASMRKKRMAAAGASHKSRQATADEDCLVEDSSSSEQINVPDVSIISRNAPDK